LNRHKHYLSILWANLIWIILGLILLTPTTTSAVQLVVIIEGVEDFEAELETNILAYLTIEQVKNNKNLSEDRIQRYFFMGTGEIQEALKPFGYYQTKVKAEIKKDDMEWRIYYKINPGPAAKIELIDIRINGVGENETHIQAAVSEFPLRINDRVVHALYERGKRTLLRSAIAQGYLDAKFTNNQIIIDPQVNNAAIHLHLETGKPYFFGKIELEPVKVKESLLRRYLDFKPGDRYSGKAVLDFQAALESSGYFARVAVIPERALATDYTIPITVELLINKPNKFDFGLGYGTDTGMRGRVVWNRRLLGNNGHTFNIRATVSQIKQEFRSSYYIPWRNPRKDRIELGAGLQNKETDTSTSIEKTFGVSLQQKYKHWRESQSIRIENTKFNVGKEGWRVTEMLILGTHLTKIASDSFDLVWRGTKIGFGLTGAWDKAFSDISFLRVEVNGKLVLPITQQGRVLLRGKLGAMTVSDFDQLPPNYRYFAGGDSNIRGYRYESQGPKNESGNVIGGKNIIVTSVEFDYAIAKNWRLAVFWDGGNAFNTRGDPIIQGAGIGMRYQLPIGMMRVDIAQAITDPDRPWRVHITIGPDL